MINNKTGKRTIILKIVFITFFTTANGLGSASLGCNLNKEDISPKTIAIVSMIKSAVHQKARIIKQYVILLNVRFILFG